jgi:hypothetical protein
MTAVSTPRGVRTQELKKRMRQIESWYPYAPKDMPGRVDAEGFFISDPRVVSLVEDHLVPSMPAALFFSGTYRVGPKGRNALEIVLADFEQVLEQEGHQGRYFAVAHRNRRDGHVHVHALVDHGPAIVGVGKRWGASHGMWRAGLADPGGYYYVARHASDPDGALVLDRTQRPAAARG